MSYDTTGHTPKLIETSCFTQAKHRLVGDPQNGSWILLIQVDICGITDMVVVFRYWSGVKINSDEIVEYHCGRVLGMRMHPVVTTV